MICPNCKNEVPKDSKICQYCGIKFKCRNNRKVISEKFNRIKSYVKKIPDKIKKCFDNKRLRIIIITLATLFVLFLTYILFFTNSGIFSSNNYRGKKSDTSVLFISNGSLCYYDNNCKEPFILSESNISGSKEALYEFADIHVSKKDERIFYYQNLHKNDNSEVIGELCYRSLKNNHDKPMIIDSDVSAYKVSDKHNLVLYQKNGYLYRFDIKKKTNEQISSLNDISSVVFLKNGEYTYIDSESNLYIDSADNPKKLICQNVSALYPLYDYSAICFETESVSNVELKLKNFVEYDITSFEEPKEPAFPSESDYNSRTEYEAAYNEWSVAYDKYMNELITVQRQKRIADELETAVYSPHPIYAKRICLYNNGKTTTLSDCGAYNPLGANGGYYTDVSYDFKEKIKLSSLQAVDDVKSFIDTFATGQYLLLLNGEILKPDLPDRAVIKDVNDNFSELCYIIPETTGDNESAGKLYKLSGTNGLFSNTEFVDDNVCHAYYYGSSFVYTKNHNTKNDTYDYYVNGKKHDSVYRCIIKDENNYAYVKNPVTDNNGKLHYTLYICKDDTENVVSDGVLSFSFSESNDLIYTLSDTSSTYKLYRYSRNEPKLICEKISEAVITSKNEIFFISDKDMYIFRNDKSEKIAENVTCINTGNKL